MLVGDQDQRELVAFEKHQRSLSSAPPPVTLLACSLAISALADIGSRHASFATLDAASPSLNSSASYFTRRFWYAKQRIPLYLTRH